MLVLCKVKVVHVLTSGGSGGKASKYASICGNSHNVPILQNIGNASKYASKYTSKLRFGLTHQVGHSKRNLRVKGSSPLLGVTFSYQAWRSSLLGPEGGEPTIITGEGGESDFDQ